MRQNPGATPFELFALLLLFGLPSVLTLLKLSELFGFGERSHQLHGLQESPQINWPLDQSILKIEKAQLHTSFRI